MVPGRRSFSVESATAILPQILLLLEHVRQARRAKRKSEADLAAYKKRLTLSGGAFPNQNRLAAYTDQVKSSYVMMKAALDQISDQGVELRDVDQGILDFPARMAGEAIYLCYQLGEHTVSHWRKVGEPYSQRRTLLAEEYGQIDLDPLP
jgi:hypothetical protein